MAYDLSLQYHSLRIYDTATHYYDTWNDFHLIPSERPTVAIPKANSKLVTIPGRKNPIDLTTYLTGHSTFTNRQGSWRFFTDPVYVERNLGGWIAFDKRLKNLFHGHVAKVILRDDPSYFYVGELTMSEWKPEAAWSSINISYNFYPYKKSVTSSLDHWTFDDFDFRDGIIQYLKEMEVNGTRTVNVYGSPERISPHINGTPGILIDKYENNSWVSYGYVPTDPITDQKTIIPRFVIDDGINQLRFRGNGTVTIDYRRGLL